MSKKQVLYWVVAFLAFPPAGLIAHAIAGPIDDVVSALLAGLIAGAILGTGQWLALRTTGVAPTWIPATAAGLTVALVVSEATGFYGETMGALAATGLVSGLAVGTAQWFASRDAGPVRLAWIPVSAALWALGWVITTAVGVDVDQRWAVFGASGAVTFAILSGAALFLMARRDERSDATSVNEVAA